MITLFGNLESGNVHKVQLVLRFLETPYVRVDVSQTRGEATTEAFLKLNPIGKFPAVRLESGDIITESCALLFYFSQATPLWPSDLREQTEVIRWLSFEQNVHEPTLARSRYLRRFTKAPQEHREQLAVLRSGAVRALQALEVHLKGRDWLVGQACTIADYALYPYTRVADESGFTLADYPSILQWLERIESQPRFIPMGDEGAERTVGFDDYFGPCATRAES